MPTDEQMTMRSSLDPRRKMRRQDPSPEAAMGYTDAPAASAAPSGGMRSPVKSTEYFSGGMEGAAPAPTNSASSGVLSPEDMADAATLKEHLRARMHAAQAKVAQARMGAVNPMTGRPLGMAAGNDPAVAAAQSELDMAIRDFANIHKATAPSTLDQTPEQRAAAAQSLRDQYRTNVAGIKGQNSVAASDAATTAARATDEAKRFFLGGYEGGSPNTMPVPHAQGNEVLTDPYAARDRAQNVAMVRARSAAANAQEAGRVERDYNPPAEYQPAPETDRDARLAERTKIRQRLMDQAGPSTESLPAFRKERAAEMERAQTESAIQAEVPKAQLEQVRAQTRMAKLQGTSIDPQILAQQGETADAKRSASYKVANFNPEQWMSEASDVINQANASRGVGTSMEDTKRIEDAINETVIAPLERLAAVNPEEAKIQAAKVYPSIVNTMPSSSYIIPFLAGLAGVPQGVSDVLGGGKLSDQQRVRSEARARLKAIGKKTQ